MGRTWKDQKDRPKKPTQKPKPKPKRKWKEELDQE